MLEARAVTLAHGRSPVVRDASLNVAPGDLVALCGPNGAGKSSLLAALAGELRPRAGRITIYGADMAALPAPALAKLRAVLEQTPTVAAPFSVAALAALGIPRALPQLRAAAIVAEVLEGLGLAALADRPIDRLSGGQQHRAHLARALAQLAAGRALGGGRYLFLDEPTASLDLAHQAGAMTAARRAADAGAGVVVVLHDLTLAAAFADRIVLMNEGRIVIEGAPAEVLTEAHLTQVYASPLRILAGPGGRPIVVPVYAGVDAGQNLEECHVHHGTQHPHHPELRLSQGG